MTRECYNVLYKKWESILTMKNLHCIPNLNEIEEYLSLCAEYGMVFEYNEFFSPDLLTDPEAYEKAEKAYLAIKRNRANDTLHGAFYDINIASDDPDIRKISDKRIRAGMESAKKLGARGVIFHTNYIANFTLKSYRDAWVERCAAYLINGENFSPPGSSRGVVTMQHECTQLCGRRQSASRPDSGGTLHI